MMKNMKTTAIVLAAGSGSRMHSEVKKQYMEIGGNYLPLRNRNQNMILFFWI